LVAGKLNYPIQEFANGVVNIIEVILINCNPNKYSNNTFSNGVDMLKAIGTISVIAKVFLGNNNSFSTNNQAYGTFNPLHVVKSILKQFRIKTII
jgi:hypothetical protein